MSNLRVLELFAGIGACTTALERLNIPHTVVDAVEIDKFAIKSYNAIHGTSFEPQDITKWDKDIKVDLVMHGSPCQDFSIAGLQKGGDKGSGTRSSLMYETLRIVDKLKPKYVIWENVKGMMSKKHRHNFDNYLNAMAELGYSSKYKVLNAKGFGIPQNRERVFTVSILGDNNFEFPEPNLLTVKLKDILDEVVDEKYYLTNEQTAKLKWRDEMMEQKGNGFRHYPDGDKEVASSLVARDYKQPQCVQVANIDYYNYDKMNRVYDTDGISPTLDTMTGGNREPKIVDDLYNSRPARVTSWSPALRAKMDVLKVMDKYAVASRGRYQGKKAKQQLEMRTDGVTNALTTVQKDNYVTDTVRVRKLTPNECWRLMGFTDENFKKAEKVNSNSQLYKQAGNSIVVNVLEAVLTNLLLNKERL